MLLTPFFYHEKCKKKKKHFFRKNHFIFKMAIASKLNKKKEIMFQIFFLKAQNNSEFLSTKT
jgi:hypothetical protein